MDGGGAGGSRQHRVCSFVWRGLGGRRAGDPQPFGLRAQHPPLDRRVSRGLGLSTGTGQPPRPCPRGGNNPPPRRFPPPPPAASPPPPPTPLRPRQTRPAPPTTTPSPLPSKH